MDIFGLGNMIKGATAVTLHSSRRTGKTTLLLNNVRDGDRVVFGSHASARDFESRCKERGVKVECIVLEPRRPERLFGRQKPTGRTHFDHTWIEDRYMLAIEGVTDELDEWTRRFSSVQETAPKRVPLSFAWNETLQEYFSKEEK